MSHKDCIELLVERVRNDTTRLYTDLEPKPCQRAIAMLLQCVPILAFLFGALWLYLIAPTDPGYPVVGALCAALMAFGGTIALVYIVCCDVMRAAYQQLYGENEV